MTIVCQSWGSTPTAYARLLFGQQVESGALQVLGQDLQVFGQSLTVAGQLWDDDPEPWATYGAAACAPITSDSLSDAATILLLL